MKKVIWGTGFYAGQFAYTMQNEGIDFFIDNDEKKRGKYLLGKKILCPDEIENWNELYIYLPFNYYDEIIEQLKKYGMSETGHFHKYYDSNRITDVECKIDFENALNMLQKNSEKMRNMYLFWGFHWACENKGYGKGYRIFLQEWKEKNIISNMGLISEALWYTQEYSENISKLPVVLTPGIFGNDIYVKCDMPINYNMGFLKEKKFFNWSVLHLQSKYIDMTENDAYIMVYYIYQYIIQVLEILQPRLIIVCSVFPVAHHILEDVCKEMGVPLISTHPGILPGTLAFDIGGEMGKSLPALYPERFLELPVDEADLGHAQKVWDFLYISKLNRKNQYENGEIEYIMEKIDPDKPIVFFAGQNDNESNMVPYTEETRKYHSPIFRTSVEAGIYIAELCEKNGWNFVYKPHPMSLQHDNKEQLPTNTIYVGAGNINDLIDISDVVVTILSTTNYISLIRHKPAVMLGYTQTKGKGCTYEAFEKDLIEDTIKEALDKGFTKEQEEAFLKHIAQVLKYYLYDDGVDREIRFGRQVPSSIEEFYELEELLKEDEGAE